MDANECGRLLAQMAVYDYRDVDVAVITAWLDVIGDLPYEDCRAAVKAHYSASTERMMPANVRDFVRELRRNRLQDTQPAGRPPSDPEGYAAWLRSEHIRIMNGQPEPDAIEGPR